MGVALLAVDGLVGVPPASLPGAVGVSLMLGLASTVLLRLKSMPPARAFAAAEPPPATADPRSGCAPELRGVAELGVAAR